MPPKSEPKRPSKPIAVALRYAPPEDTAPVVVAKGGGFTARKIIEVAEEHGIPVREDPNLVKMLATLDLNDEIPQEIYAAVAHILAFVHRVGRTRTKKKSK